MTDYKQINTLTLYTFTEREWVTFVILDTTTRSYVIDDRAFRILAANSIARTYALIIRASSIVWTVGILYTFRSTLSVWIATIFGYAIADTVTTLGIEPTW